MHKRRSSGSRSARLKKLHKHLVDGWKGIQVGDLTEKDLVKLTQLAMSIDKRSESK